MVRVRVLGVGKAGVKVGDGVGMGWVGEGWDRVRRKHLHVRVGGVMVMVEVGVVVRVRVGVLVWVRVSVCVWVRV